MWFTKVSIRNPYFATVIMVAIFLLGLIALKKISAEEFPNIKFPIAVVTTNYQGASPDVVETEISRSIEEALNTISGIKIIRSYSFEGQSIVVAEFNLSVDPNQALIDARDKVASVASGFRKEISNPEVSTVNIQDQPIMSIAISSDTMSLRDITDWVKSIAKKKLQTVIGVGDVKIIGGVYRQVRINIQPYKLQALGLSVQDVVNAIQNSNKNFPAGDVKADNKNISIRLAGKLLTPQDFASIVITYRNNVPIKISDIADVVDGHDEYNSLTLVDGHPAVNLDIRKTTKANTVDVADGVYAMLDTLNQIKPQGVNIKVTYDSSQAVKNSLDNVGDTIFEGAFLTILIVFLFLKSWRSTVITGLTLPIALVGTIFAIYAMGFTLNMMSLLALSLSVGLLIDDAIVVRENIVRHLHMGKNHYQAALDGTNEIGLAVFATTCTVIAVFLPVGFMQGIIGKFFFQFGITVSVAVIISLLVSFMLDPMLSSIWHEPKDGGWLMHSKLGVFLNWFERGFDKVGIFYEKFIRLSLNYRKSTLLAALITLVGSFMLVPLIGGEFMPKVDKGQYLVAFKTDIGSNISYTENKITQVDKILRANIKEIKTITAGINKNFGDGTNNASLTIDIGNKNSRHHTLDQVMQQTRMLLSNVGGIVVQNVMPLGSAGGDDKPVWIDIEGDNMEILTKVANDLMQKLGKIPGVVDLENSYQQANPAYNIKVERDLASSLGINLADIGNTISVLFGGNKVSTWDDPKSGQSYDVVVQIPDDERKSNIFDVLKVPSNKFGANNVSQMVPLSEIVTFKSGLSPRELDHVNLRRKVTITGNVAGKDLQTIFDKIQAVINQYPKSSAYYINQSGSKQDMEESFSYAVFSLLIGVVFIYMILCAQFKSFILPLVIMIALPLSFIGVFIALFLFGSTLNMFSIIGIIMLMGLATKNGILLVDFINQQVKQGMPVAQAIIAAGKVRLRPILMTSCAMIFGMLPLALSSSEGAEVRKPMAYAIIGGMTTSTILTLIIVPVIYSYLTSKFSKKDLQ